MLAIAINYLNGQVKAATYNSAGAAVEWPPHPDRVYMALVAAWGETGQDCWAGCSWRRSSSRAGGRLGRNGPG